MKTPQLLYFLTSWSKIIIIINDFGNLLVCQGDEKLTL